jgi:RHS repeat-associated protein
MQSQKNSSFTHPPNLGVGVFFSGGDTRKIGAEHGKREDYSPFGVTLDGRTQSSSGYRYGFQGQESDDEIKGAGNSVNYKYRMHDPRVGRFFAVDPLAKEYPGNSVYAFSENVVINAVELEGKEKSDVITNKNEKKEVLGPYSKAGAEGLLGEDLKTGPSGTEISKPTEDDISRPSMKSTTPSQISQHKANLNFKQNMAKMKNSPLNQMGKIGQGLTYGGEIGLYVVLPGLAAPRALRLAKNTINVITAERVMAVGMNYVNQSIADNSIGFGSKDQIGLGLSLMLPKSLSFGTTTSIGLSSSLASFSYNRGLETAMSRPLGQSVLTGLNGAIVNMGQSQGLGLLKNPYANSLLFQGFGGLHQRVINNGF